MALAAPAAAMLLLASSVGLARAQGSAEWNKVVAAAKQEKTVVCGCPPVPATRKFVLDEFKKAYPDITLEYTPATLPDFASRVTAERSAGQYLWDVYWWGPGPEIYRLANAGAFEPIASALLLPDVNDPKVWGGWDKVYIDNANKYVFSFWQELSGISVNAKMVNPADLKQFRDLLDPKYKGKIVWWDPRAGGGGSNAAAFIHQRHGEDAFKKIFVDQEPVLVPNNTDVGERMARGTFPIGIGGDLADVLKPYVDAGMDIDIRLISLEPDWAWSSVGYGTTTLFNRAPHPNAAKVFLNWLLSKETQTKMSAELKRNSRRTDVPPASVSSMPKHGEQYFVTQSERAVLEFRQNVIALAKKLRPQ
jgi:iron(III) transport system substrate-binding protein